MEKGNNLKCDVSGKNVLITGCARGLGLEITRSFVKEGCNIIALDKNKNLSNLDRELKRLNPKINVFIESISILNEDKLLRLKKKLNSEGIFIDIIVNNVGITLVDKFRKQKIKDWKEQLETNTIGMMLITQIFGQDLINNRYGKIVNISSVDALVPKLDQDTELGVKGVVVYASTKGAVISFTKALAVEWAEFNIRVNAVCPSLLDVPSTQDIMTIPGNKDKYISRLPLKKLVTTNNIADTVLFLSSDMSDGITGQAIIVDNGYSAKDV